MVDYGRVKYSEVEAWLSIAGLSRVKKSHGREMESEVM